MQQGMLTSSTPFTYSALSNDTSQVSHAIFNTKSVLVRHFNLTRVKYHWQALTRFSTFYW